MKATGNPVANFDPSNSFADRGDLAGAAHTGLRRTAIAASENH